MKKIIIFLIFVLNIYFVNSLSFSTYGGYSDNSKVYGGIIVYSLYTPNTGCTSNFAYTPYSDWILQSCEPINYYSEIRSRIKFDSNLCVANSTLYDYRYDNVSCIYNVGSSSSGGLNNPVRPDSWYFSFDDWKLPYDFGFLNYYINIFLKYLQMFVNYLFDLISHLIDYLKDNYSNIWDYLNLLFIKISDYLIDLIERLKVFFSTPVMFPESLQRFKSKYLIYFDWLLILEGIVLVGIPMWFLIIILLYLIKKLGLI